MKFNNLIEVRDYLDTIPENKWGRWHYYNSVNDTCCAIGHIHKAITGNIDEQTNTRGTENLIDELGKSNLVSYITSTNDMSENPKQAVIELLNQRIYDLAN